MPSVPPAVDDLRTPRLVLKDGGLPPSGEVYDRAYAYVREHY